MNDQKSKMKGGRQGSARNHSDKKNGNLMKYNSDGCHEQRSANWILLFRRSQIIVHMNFPSFRILDYRFWYGIVATGRTKSKKKEDRCTNTRNVTNQRSSRWLDNLSLYCQKIWSQLERADTLHNPVVWENSGGCWTARNQSRNGRGTKKKVYTKNELPTFLEPWIRPDIW